MTHIEILRTFNNWRRDMVGEKTLEDFGITPRMIGEALDAVIRDAERYQWVRDQHNDLAGGCWVAVCHASVWVSLDSATLGDNRELDLDLDSAVDAAMAKESRQ
jgi:hypothetical protein